MLATSFLSLSFLSTVYMNNYSDYRLGAYAISNVYSLDLPTNLSSPKTLFSALVSRLTCHFSSCRSREHSSCSEAASTSNYMNVTTNMLITNATSCTVPFCTATSSRSSLLSHFSVQCLPKLLNSDLLVAKMLNCVLSVVL